VAIDRGARSEVDLAAIASDQVCVQVTRFAAPLAYNYLHVIRMQEYLGSDGVSSPAGVASFTAAILIMLPWSVFSTHCDPTRGHQHKSRCTCGVQSAEEYMASARFFRIAPGSHGSV